MSFQKNPPWQKNVAMPNFQQQMSLQQLNQIGFLSNQLGFTNAQPMLQMNQLVNQVPTVQYPTTRVNPMAFQQQPSPQQSSQGMQQQQHQQQQQQQQQPSKYNASQKIFSGTGVVSKIQNDIGFIDDEVLFHKNVCTQGSSPKRGDHVLVEAAYNQNMPFKWNATRVQVLSGSNSNNSPGGSMQHNSKSYGSVPPPRDSGSDAHGQSHGRNRRDSQERRPMYNRATYLKSPERVPRSRDRRDADEDNERKRRREDRDRDRERSHRPRESLELKERSPLRKPSPKRRRVRVVPRYMVQIPKISVTFPVADIIEIKKRYQNMYVPSDFFSSGIKWIEAFPANAPFSINKTCSYHVMSKEVAPLDEIDAVLDPPDSDYLYSAKVMLMSTPAIQDIYKKCFAKAEDTEKVEDAERDFIHPTRLINFLVGLRGKNETMAIGGAWSKKLDGENPQSDPTVLIRTAIRTCKALTGIDLSNCTQWYRFVELYYRRSEQAKDKDKSGSSSKSARIETTVIFLPDTSSIMPNQLEWEGVQSRYKEALQSFLASKEQPATVSVDDDDGTKEIPIITISDDNDVAMEVAADVDDVKTSVKNAVVDEVLAEPVSDVVAVDEDGDKEVETAAAVVVNPDSSITDKALTDNNQTEDEDVGVIDADEESGEATHFSQLDPKTMKVAELRAELNARNLPSKGLKNQLVARLLKAIQVEADPTLTFVAADESDDVVMVEADVVPEEQKTSESIEETSEEKSKDEGETEMNIAEMDMSEVTIIDEYDSTKCEEEKIEKPREKKKEEPRKLDEKERHQIEKRYQLPDSPQIMVHPSKTAKSGKFDCTVMSLSVLLDYRPEDTKEHSFEVSLFAELFNEMLTRDFGFNIFKAINYFPPIKAKEESKDDDKKKEVVVELVDGEKSNEAEAKKESEVEVKEEIKDGDKKDKKRPHADDSDDSLATRSDRSRSKRDKDGKDAKVERPKYVTAFPDLLLSFTYFDQTHCGYIFEKDLEDLFYTLGLNLSRSQVRKMAEKFVTRDSLYYRKLTDRLADVPYVNPYENVSEEQLAELARGNRAIKTSSASADNQGELTNVDASGGLVQFNGSLVNIQQLLEQMRRSEASRENTERLLVDLRQKNGDLSTSNIRNEKRIKDLNSDLKSMSRKLQDAESSLSSATRKQNDYYSVLTSINERVAPIIAKNEKSRERSDRDRERSDRKKDSDKDKDKKPRDDDKSKDSKETITEVVKKEVTAEVKEEGKVEQEPVVLTEETS